MRFRKLLALSKREWLPLTQAALAALTGVTSVLTGFVPTYFLALAFLSMAVLSYLDNRSNRIQVESQKQSELETALKDERFREEAVQQMAAIQRAVERRQQALQRDLDKTKSAATLLTRLVDEGLIDESRILKEVDTASGILIYCYAYPVGYSAKSEEKPRREYPHFLENELGCIRLPPKTSTAFLTTFHRLPPELHEFSKLKAYIEHRFEQTLAYELDTFQAKIDAGEATASWRVQRHGTTDRGLRATVIVSRLPIARHNILRINGGASVPRFYELLSEIVDLRRVSLASQTKISVRRFVLAQAFDLILEDESQAIKKKMSEARPALDAHFSCDLIFDYLSVNPPDLQKELKTFLEDEDAERISGKLFQRLHVYEQALRELRIGRLRS